MTATTFGLGMLSAQRAPGDPRDDREIYADLLDLCEFAEAAGFDGLWLSEHHFVDDGYMPSVLAVAAAIAARTNRIRIGTGILVAPLHDPLRLAEDAATVDLISGGRLVLGIGAGYRDEEFAGFGVEKTKLGAVLDHVVDVLRGSWGEGVVEPGRDRPPLAVTPKPARPEGPPIWLGARSPAGIRRAARIADGLLAARVSPEEFGEQVAMLLAAHADQGRHAPTVATGVHCPVFAWPDDHAWEIVEPHLHYVEWKYRDMGTPYGTRMGAASLPPLDGATRAQLRGPALVGDAEEVARGIVAFARQAGGTAFEFIARLYWPGMDRGLQREALSYYAAEVIPAVRRIEQVEAGERIMEA